MTHTATSQSRRLRRGVAAAVLLVGAQVSRADILAHTYPPSCFADGLPKAAAAHDPHVQSLPLTLHGDFNACFVNPAAPSYPTAQQECNYSETVALTVYRVACSGGYSATLLEIDRATGMSGNTDLYPTFPGVWVQADNQIAYIRLAADPNTTNSRMYVNGPVYTSSVYTLENIPGETAFDYNEPFTLTIDNNTGDAVQYDLGAYKPADYAAAALGMPLTGYLTGSWYDPAHGGEGILTEVLDNGDNATRTFVVTWYTYDALGVPTWLVGQQSFPIGTTQLANVPMQYVTGGAFGGASNGVTRNAWGSFSAAFADCNHLHFSYSGNAGANGPGGSGARDWVRIGNLQALTCQ